MRLYAGIISYIAMVSLAANVGIGYYLYTYEQTNRLLQTHILALQQQKTADADRMRDLQKTITIKEQLLTYTRAQLHDATRPTHIEIEQCPQQLDAQQVRDAQTPAQLQHTIQEWYTRTTADTLVNVTVQRRATGNSADFQMVLFLTKKSDKTPYIEMITINYVPILKSTTHTHTSHPVHMIISTTCLLYVALP